MSVQSAEQNFCRAAPLFKVPR